MMYSTISSVSNSGEQILYYNSVLVHFYCNHEHFFTIFEKLRNICFVILTKSVEGAFSNFSQSVFTYSKSTVETPGKCVKSVLSSKYRDTRAASLTFNF